jgi:hypothetical protein
MVRIRRVLGLAAVLAAARAAWLHHQDNQSVIRTDLMRECFAAGQASERTRAAEEARTARVWTGWSGPPLEPFVADFYDGPIGDVGFAVEPEDGSPGWTEWDPEHRNGPGVST